MPSWRPWGIALIGCLAIALPAGAFDLPNAPTYRYPVTPEAGEWMVCVTSYKDGYNGNTLTVKAQDMAEELAEFIRSEYKLPAFLFDWGKQQQEAEKQRIAELRKKHEEFIKSMKIPPDQAPPFRVRTFSHMPNEFAVLVGGWKDMDTARKALDQIRKLKTKPPDKLLDRVIQADRKEGIESPVSPFITAMVVRNPTAPKKERQDDKPDPLLKELNASNKYSTLKCSKDWTLVVKVFHGTTQLGNHSSGGFLSKLGFGSNTGEVLNASALQAEALAGVLRDKQFGLESYVLHMRYSSIVSVGQFDGPDDPKIREVMLTLSKVKDLQVGGQRPDMEGFFQLMQQPMPMKIPRP